MTLDQLFSPDHLLRDTDGDSVADGVAAFLVLLESNLGAIDLAVRLGLESTGLTLPVAGTELPPGRAPVYIGVPPGMAVPFAVAEFVWLSPEGVVVQGERAARWLAATVVRAPAVAALFRADGSVELVGESGETLAVLAGTLPGEGGSAEGGSHLGAGALPLAGRLPAAGAPTSGVESAPLTDLAHLYGPTLHRQILVPPGASIQEIAALCDLGARFGVEASTVHFPVAVSEGAREPAASQGALQPAAQAGALPPTLSWAPTEPDGITLNDGHVHVGGWAALRYLADTFPYVGAWGPPHGDLRWLRRPIPPPLQPGETVLALDWSGEWEVDALRRRWREVAPSVQPGYEVDIRLSEPRAERERLARELADSARGAQVHVRSAHKQGFCWVEEEVLPRLRALGPIARITIQFRRFTGRAPAGETALELPIRWLQELYPVDDLLAEALGIEPGVVTFAMVEEGPTYRLTAYSLGGDEVFVDTFEAVCGLRLYMSGRPHRGWVHPVSGWLTVREGARTVLTEPLMTDAALFWDWYQSEALARVREAVLALDPRPERQPFFADLTVEAWLSEENRRLEIREEQISPLDALHEDLYFFTLDWFAELGREAAGAPFTAPGGILPWVRAAPGGRPRAKVTLRLARSQPEPQPAGRLTAVHFANGVVTGMAVDGAPVSLASLTAWGAGRVEGFGTRSGREPGAAEGRTASTLGWAPGAGLRGEKPGGSGPGLDQVIGPAQLPALLSRLADLPGVTVWRAGRSLAGRDCWAIEVRLPSTEAIRPPGKLSACKPVLLINARHHANEVSSTNAVLQLVEQLAAGPLRDRLRRCSVVINPLENVDGAAIHYEMAREHPTWKLHAARFNAAGLEFYGEWFNPETVHGEARVVQDLFGAYLPDIFLDDHGVPSHEWIQPFSGYGSAPYFRVSYWLPNAILYGIFRDLDPDTHPAQAAAMPILRSILTERVRGNDALFRWNQLWLDRYRKYGHAWAPDRFPLEVHDGMICYTWPVRGHAFSAKYPEICVIDWVTEVPDETAQGAHLRLCAEAHLEAHLACLHFFERFPQPVVRTGGGGVVRVGRERPFQVGEAAGWSGGGAPDAY